ncbi:MAG: hypothetical protein HYT77_02345 [Deltaproteobacteria bacterium]|nr:hypothetical protein [Deltaproteobacteria bacterium]
MPAEVSIERAVVETSIAGRGARTPKRATPFMRVGETPLIARFIPNEVPKVEAISEPVVIF